MSYEHSILFYINLEDLLKYLVGVDKLLGFLRLISETSQNFGQSSPLKFFACEIRTKFVIIK